MNSIREKVAQTAIFLIDGTEQINETVGGIFVGAQIITQANDKIETVKDIVSKYQRQSNIPLLVTSDFENGCGSMIHGLTPLPYQMGLGAVNSEQLAYDYGKVTALEAKSVGVNWSFSPVSDLNLNPRNPLVNVRGISDDPDIAIPLLKNIIAGMQENGLAACAKHFPGDGVDWRDQHITTTSNSLKMDDWRVLSGRVFQKLIDAGVYSIMAGHISLPYYQKERYFNDLSLPATLSQELITNLLKNEMNFDGVVISDALNMGGFLGWYDTKEKAEIECFKAGCDMLLWPTRNYIDNLVNAIENGYISTTRLDDAISRIMKMKEKLGLFASEPKFHKIAETEKIYIKSTQQEIAEKSVTLVRDTDKILPLDRYCIKKILLIPVTHYEPALDEARRIRDEIQNQGIEVIYQEEYFADSNLEALIDQVDYVIYALFTRSFRPIGPVDFMANEARKIVNSLNYGADKTIIISFGSPYFINQYFERAKIYINAYSMLKPSIEAFVKALFGEKPLYNFSPIKL